MIRKANNNVCGLLSRTRVVDAQRPSHASEIRLFPEPNATDPIAKPPLIGTVLHKIDFKEMQCRRWPPRYLHGLSSQICLAGRTRRLISGVASDLTSPTTTTHLHAKEGKRRKPCGSLTMQRNSQQATCLESGTARSSRMHWHTTV
jgi:hypothetical protein